MTNRWEQQRTAIHEAGHAVMAYLLRRSFRTITVVPGGDYPEHAISG
jgi:hypothetical protein